jgi:hypothetical protein
MIVFELKILPFNRRMQLKISSINYAIQQNEKCACYSLSSQMLKTISTNGNDNKKKSLTIMPNSKRNRSTNITLFLCIFKNNLIFAPDK